MKRFTVAVVAVAVGLAMPAQAGDPFAFGWTPGAVKVTSSEHYGPIKIRRTMDVVLEADGDEYLVREKNVKVTSVEGPLTQAQVEAVEKFAAPLKRPLEVDSRGVATAVSRLDEELLEKLKASLPADEVVRSLVELQLESMEQIDRLDERKIHLWNAVVGYWTGRDQSMLQPVRAKLPDGRILKLEHLGPVSKPPRARHLSATVTGAAEGDVRGCSPATIAGLPSALKGTASTAELVHILDNVSCETTEVTEAVVDPDTLRPHLVVLDMTTKVNLPGRAAMEQKATVRWDYVWPKKGR